MSDDDHYSRDELRTLQCQLECLAQTTTQYPLECSLGECALLFESRDDIEVMIDSLNHELDGSSANARDVA